MKPGRILPMLKGLPCKTAQSPQSVSRSKLLTLSWVPRCMTAVARRRHKNLFLEILQTSKQIHFEASTIIYGCNVLKFRCNFYHRHPRTPVAVTLPTRHLDMLKNIKIAVISAKPERGETHERFQRTVELIRCFAIEGLDLETFEISWFGGVTTSHAQCSF